MSFDGKRDKKKEKRELFSFCPYVMIFVCHVKKLKGC